ncbi:MAG: UDP-N-acetylmuramate dehydrogenase [Clostridia bacterium]|nr:UDP-N-acetylmuramate dehydrogenase [Clostridia bacterium]
MFTNIDFVENVDLKNFSTMKTGGIARWMVFPKNHLEILEVLKECRDRKLKWFVLGNGSNVLFDDSGFDGVIISLKHLNKVSMCGKNCVRVGAGCNLFALNLKLQNMGLSGLEWSYGIPATLGGLLVMNGGCFGHEICELVEEVVALDDGKIRVLKNDECGFSYRYSNLSKFIVLNAKLKFFSCKNEVILENMTNFINKKRETQPCEFPSLGSVFKVVRRKGEKETIYPAKLIDNLGLKSVKIGGAEISQKHAGFIINKGGATSKDVLDLIDLVELKLAAIGVFPEREIIVLKNEKERQK